MNERDINARKRRIETLLHAADDLIEADVAVLEDDVQVAVCLGPDEHHSGYDRVEVMLEGQLRVRQMGRRRARDEEVKRRLPRG